MTNDKTDLPRIRIKPLNDLVLLQRKKAPAQTASGIHLPDRQNHAHGRVIECRVLAVGPGSAKHRLKMALTPGDLVTDEDWVAAHDAVKPVAVGDVVLVCEEALHPVTHDGLDLDFCQAGSLFGAVELD